MKKVEFVVDGEIKVAFDVPDKGGEVLRFEGLGCIKCGKDSNLIFDNLVLKTDK